MRIKSDYLAYGYFAIIVILIILMFTGLFSSITKTSLVVISNPDANSMAPTYLQGDLFVIYKVEPEDINIGDVIVYDGGNERIIHRVIDIEIIDGEYYYRTKGDSIENIVPDAYGSGFLVPYEVVLGKTMIRIPQLGHISLALQNDPATQIFVYMIVAIVVIAILFWPEEEEEGEESDFVEFSISRLKQILENMKQKSIMMYTSLSGGKARLLGFLILISLILLLLSPVIFPVFLNNPYNEPYGVKDAYVSHERRLTNNFQEVNYFLQISVEFFDYSSRINRIDNIKLDTFHVNGENETLLSSTSWNTLRSMKGEFAYGGSAFLKGQDLVNGTNELNIMVTMDISTSFSGTEQIQYTFGYELEVIFSES